MATTRCRAGRAVALFSGALFFLALGSSGAAHAAGCDGRQAAGYRVLHTAGGRPIAVWYPSAQPERPAQIGTSGGTSGGTRASVAVDAAPADCGRRHPLVLFSHGLGGCGLQSLHITEELARHGYVVAAPDHRDATLCAVAKARSAAAAPGSEQPPFYEPQRWSDQSHIDRLIDLRETIDALGRDPALAPRVDRERIGAIGHSLGGYTLLGMAGGWQSWKQPALKAVVALSPYLLPFLEHGSLARLEVAVMYQGAVFDWGITPALEGPNGAYARTSAPKYLVKLNGGTHFEWTNLVCVGLADVEACLKARPNAYWAARYAIEFLDQHLKGRPSALLRSNGTGLDSYRFDPRPPR